MKKSLILTIGILADERPATFLNLNDGQGGYAYRHNIQEVNVEDTDHGQPTIVPKATKTSRKAFTYDSILLKGEKTANAIFEKLLTEKYDRNTEAKMQNDAMAYLLGINANEESTHDYEAFLHERTDLKAQVEADCTANNIPLS